MTQLTKKSPDSRELSTLINKLLSFFAYIFFTGISIPIIENEWSLGVVGIVLKFLLPFLAFTSLASLISLYVKREGLAFVLTLVATLLTAIIWWYISFTLYFTF